jgi:hypothetical protein
MEHERGFAVSCWRIRFRPAFWRQSFLPEEKGPSDEEPFDAVLSADGSVAGGRRLRLGQVQVDIGLDAIAAEAARQEEEEDGSHGHEKNDSDGPTSATTASAGAAVVDDDRISIDHR